MAVALLDTNVLFATASARDEYHDRALEIVRGIDHGALPDAVVTDYVLAELLNLSREKLGPETANRLLDRLLEGAHFEIVHSPKADFNAAQSAFRQYDALSFVDATIVAHLNRKDVEYLYSFDDDFDVVDGVSRLETADNPFR
ncbi:type II toxin-antitoxin system VapC family toxin [Halorubrum tebenquichense]|uniref:PilT protein domain protein n=1 Tax=Halorubrum tebenquichense DSM 14210 TaxID=1227485 RepID=M0DED2_9EURY|nr:PIN domain-containing protein [Halorubrum tebenquichense]ELZ33861.1 PilT protein domain protein [Halorubrum tebenquichense DSM 14210]